MSLHTLSPLPRENQTTVSACTYVRSLNDSEQRVPVAVGNGTLLLILRRVEALNN